MACGYCELCGKCSAWLMRVFGRWLCRECRGEEV